MNRLALCAFLALATPLGFVATLTTTSCSSDSGGAGETQDASVPQDASVSQDASTPQDASVPQDASMPEDAALPPAACEVNLGGYCWFKGTTAQGCAAVCTKANRSYDEGTRTFAGSNGTDANCQALGAAFSSGTFAGTWDRGGIGCGYSVGNFVRRDTDATTSTATHPTHPGRFCACK